MGYISVLFTYLLTYLELIVQYRSDFLGVLAVYIPWIIYETFHANCDALFLCYKTKMCSWNVATFTTNKRHHS